MSWASYLTNAVGNLVTNIGTGLGIAIGATLDFIIRQEPVPEFLPVRGSGSNEIISTLFENELRTPVRVDPDPVNPSLITRIRDTFLGATLLDSSPTDTEALRELIDWTPPIGVNDDAPINRFIYQNTSSLREILETIRPSVINNEATEFWSIQINGNIFILNINILERYLTLLESSDGRDLNDLLARGDVTASDHQILAEDRQSQNRYIISKTIRPISLRPSGGRVDKIIKPDHDLEDHHLEILAKMQFYTKKYKDTEHMSKMCLRNAIHVFIEEEFTTEDKIKIGIENTTVWIDPTYNHNHKIASRHLGSIADEIKCPIILRTFRANGIHVRETGNFGSEGLPGRRIEIALYKNHYIPYLQLKGSHFFGKRNTLQFFKYIDDKGYLIDLTFEEKTELKGEVEYSGLLTQNDLDIGFKLPAVYKEKKLFSLKKFPIAPLVVELDTETDTVSGDYHQVHTVCIVISSLNIEEGFTGMDAMRQALEFITIRAEGRKEFGEGLNEQPVVIYAHNLRYDIAEIVPFVGGFSYLGSCSSTKQVMGIYQNTKIVLKDSRAFISTKLADFTKMFKLLKMDNKFVHDKDPILLERLEQLNMSIEEYANNNKLSKEICPYALYSYKKNIHLPFVDLEDALEVIRAQGSNVEEFIKSATDANCIEDDKFFHMDYSLFYCLRDCQILSAGFKVFREGCIQQLGLDPINFPTISSMTFAYFQKEGVMNGIYKVTGKTRAFLQECSRGGRTMTNSNKKYVVKSRVAYIDAVSLYPAAMKELDGFLIGKGKLLTTEDIESGRYWNYDGFFVEIDITNVGNKRDFPWLRREDKTSKEYTNDFRGRMKVSKIGLELLIVAHDIEYEIIQGFYFDEGRNNRLGVVIQTIFDTRRELQIANNCLEITWKLLMNAFYGKLLMRSFSESIRVYRTSNSLNKYLCKNSDRINWIVDSTCIRGGIFCATVSTFVPKPKHSNYAHCGVEVLDMSKIIMDRPMKIAEDNNMTMIYTDTDSIQMLEAKIPKLTSIYREMYEKEMMGNDLGQFHPDFKPPGAYNKKIEPTSILGIYPDKKVYYNLVEYENLKGEMVTYEHFRYRGISKTTLLDYPDLKKLYTRLIKGEDEVVFDLNSNGQPRFKMRRDMLVSNYKLDRTEHFPGPVTYITDKRRFTLTKVKVDT